MDSLEGVLDEDAQSKHYAELHYVDRQTVEIKNDTFDLSLLNANKKKGAATRYWNRPVPSLDHKVVDTPAKKTPEEPPLNLPPLDVIVKENVPKTQRIFDVNVVPHTRKESNKSNVAPPALIFEVQSKKKRKNKKKWRVHLRETSSDVTYVPCQVVPNNNNPESFLSRFSKLIRDGEKLQSLKSKPNRKTKINVIRESADKNWNARRKECSVTDLTDSFNGGKSLEKDIKKETETVKKSSTPDIVHLVDSSENDDDDDDSVMEVEIPEPEQTFISIESSDDELTVLENPSLPGTSDATKISPNVVTCVSPVLSMVSSTSDDFIRGDCSKLSFNREGDFNMEFNFSLHGSEWPTGKNAGGAVNSAATKSPPEASKAPKEMFATPKSKRKPVKAITPDVYVIPENNVVMPFVDIYDSESSDFTDSVVDVPISVSKPTPNLVQNLDNESSLSDDLFINISKETKQPPVVVNNSSSLVEYDEEKCTEAVNNLLNPNYKFKKMTHEECAKQMDYFYNSSWGGEGFDHTRIKQTMPRGKQLWRIDLADQCLQKRNKISKCTHCKRRGHQDGRCPMRPKVCTMCGTIGHFDTKCPNKICLNCGTKNSTFSVKCRNCSFWISIKCKICQLMGHPEESCPDIWRRYHRTIKNKIPLIQSNEKPSELRCYCSGCGKKGHSLLKCRTTASKYYKSTPFICEYTPVYTPDAVLDDDPNRLNNKNDEISLTDIVDVKESTSEPLKRKPENIPEASGGKKLKSDGPSEDYISLCASPGKSSYKSSCPQPKNASSYLEVPIERLVYIAMTCNGGLKFLNLLSRKMSIECKFESVPPNHVLKIEKGKIGSKAFVCILKASEIHIPNLSRKVPVGRFQAVKTLETSMNSLGLDLGDPVQIYQHIVHLQKSRLRIMEGNIKDVIIQALTWQIKSLYAKLNAILIGQMGYCSGKECISKLHGMLRSLKTCKSKILDGKQQEDWCKFYGPVFSPSACYDYGYLLRLYKKQYW